MQIMKLFSGVLLSPASTEEDYKKSLTKIKAMGDESMH
jgi:hypothetical protein